MARRDRRTVTELQALARAHAHRATDAYEQHFKAHAAQDAYEVATTQQMGSAEAGAQALSDTEAPRDWRYRVLSGRRKWWYDKALLESDLAQMYATLAMMERTAR